ncbi:hypothetical protein A4A49_33784 [Nicotiana attenuata]|uniref:Uncharacterized protein n=1 Tax=Nicotiana attenuata TaxID=49451 RepID=A0A1J6IHH9_NICAT|nr:hypothetical protein A4A49_33784 [Nicotiana attenuata]
MGIKSITCTCIHFRLDQAPHLIEYCHMKWDGKSVRHYKVVITVQSDPNLIYKFEIPGQIPQVIRLVFCHIQMLLYPFRSDILVTPHTKWLLQCQDCEILPSLLLILNCGNKELLPT